MNSNKRSAQIERFKVVKTGRAAGGPHDDKLRIRESADPMSRLVDGAARHLELAAVDWAAIVRHPSER